MIKKNIILGISAFYHDSAAVMLVDGEIIAAAQEERFTRKKHDASFPINAIKYCLHEAKLTLSDIDEIIYSDNHKLKFSRIMATYLTYAPRGYETFQTAMHVWLGGKLNWKNCIRKGLKSYIEATGSQFRGVMSHSEHHRSHAASAFYPSPFKKAIVICLDGVGEWDCGSVWLGENTNLTKIKSLKFPHSLGLLYSAFTYYCGFKVNSGEYKLMGLAPYGEAKYTELIKEKLVDIKSDGSFYLNMEYFTFPIESVMIGDKFCELFGEPARKAETNMTQKFMDIAKSIQLVTEEIVLKIVNNTFNEFRIENLCLAGGVALNCVANGKILRDSYYKNVWIQPASGDAGNALGAALTAYYKRIFTRNISTSKMDGMSGSYLGPSYNDRQISDFLKEKNINSIVFEDFTKLTKKVSQLIVDGSVIGWFQGRMEFGPRALGARSILADPRSTKMQSQLNLKIKYRESFRPFAPAVLEEYVEEWFDIQAKSPYMLLVADVSSQKTNKVDKNESSLTGFDQLKVKRSEIPAVTHVDFSARVQTVSKETNPFFHQLITDFHQLTNCPVLINTSFNVRGEPIVCTPNDAYQCFMHTEMDYLILGNHLLAKTCQPVVDKPEDWLKEFPLD